MKPHFEPKEEGEVTKMIESHPETLKRSPRTDEITHFHRERYFMAREHEGLKWFEIDKRQYLEKAEEK